MILTESTLRNPSVDAAFGADASVSVVRARSSLAARIGMRAAVPLICLLAFVAIRHALPNGIVLYQGIALGFVASICQYLIERRRQAARRGPAAKNALLLFLLIYSFVFTIPTTVDRAYSVKMLTSLEESPSGLTRNEINRVFLNGFVSEGGVEKRLREQTSTGSIKEHDGRYVLTPFGRFIAASFRVTRVVFACGGKR